jgi:hypothetical protein
MPLQKQSSQAKHNSVYRDVGTYHEPSSSRLAYFLPYTPEQLCSGSLWLLIHAVWRLYPDTDEDKYLDIYFATLRGRPVDLPQQRVAQEMWKNFCLATYIPLTLAAKPIGEGPWTLLGCL